MNEKQDKNPFERLATESGLAIVVVDGGGQEIFSANNNSICRNLNPNGVFSPACAEFCGKALERVKTAGGSVSYECHAGLECRAIHVKNPNAPLVAIVGRTFTKADNYRHATERAITGDWRKFSPSAFFENILLSANSNILDKAAQRVEGLIEDAKQRKRSKGARDDAADMLELPPISKKHAEPVTVRSEPEVEPDPTPDRTSVKKDPSVAKAETQAASSLAETARASAWRSFFGSLLKSDYAKARDSILAFLAAQYGLGSLVWMDKRDDRLENTAAFGDMKDRKVRLGIAANDPRLIEAAVEERALELGERSGGAKGSRTMNLFPIGIGGDVTCAIAILDQLDDRTRTQIIRICRSIASQMEILRLRNEITERESLTLAVRKFGRSLSRIDADDFWVSLLQGAAETLRAERASLMIYDEKSNKLAIKAVVGIKQWSKNSGEVGGRVSKLVFAKNKALAVADVAKTGLPPAGPERMYKSASFLSCPISIGERAIGVMNFTDKATGGAFDRRSLELFQSIAPQMAVAIDRASLKNKAGEFEQLSVTDPLTGLLNRRYIEARLAEEVKRSNRHGFPMSFMMLDVDHFKSYNDQFGHPAGDEALKLVANVVRDTLRGADVAARFGGEEFSILLPQTTSDEAIAIGERIRHNIEHAKFHHRKVTASIGVASCSAELCISADLVSAADRALYEAKRRGRNRVLAFEEMGGITISQGQ